jgi:hypothetical protein
MSKERDELQVLIQDIIVDDRGLRTDLVSAAILADGYRKTESATEYGIVFNGRAVFLVPPAESLDEFKDRYESDCGWMITERDTFLTRTYTRCAPDPSAPVIHEARS